MKKVDPAYLLNWVLDGEWIIKQRGRRGKLKYMYICPVCQRETHSKNGLKADEILHKPDCWVGFLMDNYEYPDD